MNQSILTKSVTKAGDGIDYDGLLWFASKYEQPYISPTPGELPLIAVQFPPFNDHAEDKVDDYKGKLMNYFPLIKDAGFNCVQNMVNDYNELSACIDVIPMFGLRQMIRMYTAPEGDLRSTDSTTDELNKHLENNQKNKMYNETRTQLAESLRRWDEAIPATKNLEMCGAYQVADEITIRGIGNVSFLKDRILDQDPWNPLIFNCLNPVWADLTNLSGGCGNHLYVPFDSDQLEELTYEKYLDEYQKQFKPAVWLYDCYFLFGDYPSWFMNSKFFLNFEIIRKKALETNRPFWFTVRCAYPAPNGIPENQQMTIPQSNADFIGKIMGIESRCALAYGAKGLQFWQMMARSGKWPWAPIQPDTSDGTSTETTADEYVTTPYYPKVVELITDIKRYQHLFLNSIAVKTGFIDIKEEVPIGGKKARLPFGSITKIMGTNMFISHHILPDSEFYVIVNYNAERSFVLTMESDYKFRELTGRNVLDPNNGTIPPYDEGNDNSSDNNLTPPTPYKYATLVDSGDWRIFFRFI